MLMAKSPFRVSLVGGGTDLPSFYEKNGVGAVVSMGIDKYMYLMIHPYFHEKIRVKYSQTEDVDSVDALRHPIFRECLRLMEVKSGVEIASIADIPAGLGLGSSSSFTVALLHVLFAFQGRSVTQAKLAELACEIEIDRLKEPIGKQDQYAASFGGLNHITFRKNGAVEVENLGADPETVKALVDRLVMFYIGRPRPARDILREQNGTIGDGDPFRMGQELVALAAQCREAVQKGDLARIGAILHEGWGLKKKLASRISNGDIDRIYERGLKAGATGGKLLGAGAGGFMLFYCEPESQDRLRREIGLRELPFACDRDGSQLIYRE